VIEIVTDTFAGLEEPALALAELDDELDEELQAAAPRLKASAADTANPFLAT
jgi:hypothetical protein